MRVINPLDIEQTFDTMPSLSQAESVADQVESVAEPNELLAPYQSGGRPEPQLPALVPGQVVGLEGQAGLGITRLGLSLLAAPSRIGLVVALDVRGWLSPSAAWEVGVLPRRLVVIRCPDHRLWPQVTAACLEGVAAVYAEVPSGVGEQQLRRLLALNRARKSALILRPIRGELPAGITHWRVRGTGVIWEGADRGHGRLTNRTLTAQVSGKSTPLREFQLGEEYGAA